MAVTKYSKLRNRVITLTERVRLEVNDSNADLDAAYEHAVKLLDVVGELRMHDAALERAAIADALAVPVGRA